MRLANPQSTRRPPAGFAFGPAMALLVSLVLAARTSRAQVADPHMWVTDGYVNALATSGNTLYMGGSFTRVGPNTGSCVGLSAGTGLVMAGWPRVDGPVNCSVADGAGGWYVGGSFSSVGGVARAGLAHIRADMTLDAWNPGADAEVLALAIHGSTIYVGGRFARVGGQDRSCIASLDAVTGLATAWNPEQNGSPYDVQSVAALAVHNGTVYAGGTFYVLGGQPRSNAAGLDASTGLATGWDPSPNGAVAALVASGGTIYAGGSFYTIGGQIRSGLAALNATTGLATAWNPSPEYGPVNAIAVYGQTVFAGGAFSEIGGATRWNIAALDATSGLASAWAPLVNSDVNVLMVSGRTLFVGGEFTAIDGQSRDHLAAFDITSGVWTAWNPGANGSVRTLAGDSTAVCAGGSFYSVGGLARRNALALDLTSGQPTAWNPAPDAPVEALVIHGSTVYVGGPFTSVSGQPRGGLAALDASSGLAAAWNPIFAGSYPKVTALAVGNSTVYLGGRFNTVGGAARASLAAVDSASGLVTPWNPAPGGPGCEVLTLALDGQTLYVGGDFSRIGGQDRRSLAAVDVTSGLATSWNPRVAQYNGGIVYALAVSGSTVYAGGNFRDVGGQLREHLAALSAANGLPTPWNPGVSDQYYTGYDVVRALAVARGTVYVGGDFEYLGGLKRPNIAAIDSTTGQATAWNPGGQGFGRVNAVTLAGSSVCAAVASPNAGGLVLQSIALLRPRNANPPGVHVLSPNGTSPVMPGTRRLLSWFADDDLGVQSVDLYLSRGGPAGPWELLAAAAPNTGHYLWTVTGPDVPGDDAFVLVVARDDDGNLGTDICDGGFSISSDVLDTGHAPRPAGLALSLPVPNPSRGRASLSFTLPARANMQLTLIDVQGREVAVLAEGEHEAGPHTASIEAAALRPGVYFARLEAAGRAVTRRLVVVQ